MTLDEIIFGALDTLGLPATMAVDRRNPSQGVTIVAHYPNGTFVQVVDASIDAALARITTAITNNTVSG
jgi:hypothetical protein